LLFDRRILLGVLVAVSLWVSPGLLLAKDGAGAGGHDNSGSNGVGNDNRGGSDNGMGNDDGGDNDQGIGNDDADNDNDAGNDDNGTGNDDGGGDDNGIGNDDDGDDDSTDDVTDEGSRSKKREDIQWSQDRVLKERQLGRVISLNAALRIVNTQIHGRVIDVDLMERRGTPQYRVKVRRFDGLIRTVSVDARTGKVISLLGF